jgi:hypothetical protein
MSSLLTPIRGAAIWNLYVPPSMQGHEKRVVVKASDFRMADMEKMATR